MIDLDAIEDHANKTADQGAGADPHVVLALVAEVRRLRGVLASLICLPCRGSGQINNGERCATCLGTGTYEQLAYVRP